MKNQFVIEKGEYHPLGATPTETGVNFALFSENATRIELLLFDSNVAKKPFMVVEFDKAIHKTYHFWHCHVKGLEINDTHIIYYAYRVHGLEDSKKGMRFDAKKILLDPYAKGISASLYKPEDAVKSGDNLETSLRGVVVDTKKYNWENDKQLNRPWDEIVIYEMHVRGFTKSPSSGVVNPGTYAGVIEKIPYLKKLGVTAVELLPVYEFNRRDPLRVKKDGEEVHNYWGYDPIGFFTPESTYCVETNVGKNINEFRDMVKAFHKAGIEVYLDVVYNHTGEGNHLGPNIHFKGIDNSVYYHLVNGNEGYYKDYTGCGNTIKCNHPIVQKFIYDSLKFWVEEMHVDGFRFDLASVLSRGVNGEPLRYPPILWNLELSELFAHTKLIAEAWDAVGLYQIGSFSGKRWVEWNGQYRDTIRKFLRGEQGIIGDVASRIAGSSDIYARTGQVAHNSVNFVTCHDGFTMHDLVSYSNKHNEANGEHNRDGTDSNYSWNCGVEGETQEKEIIQLRKQQIKNFFAILMVSKGVPMMLSGDEIANTQNGNNNAYCQDSELSWLNWGDEKKNSDIFHFFQKMIEFRKNITAITSKEFYNGIKTNEHGFKDIEWHGCELCSPNWENAGAKELSFIIGSFTKGEPDVYVMMNMSDDEKTFQVPVLKNKSWYQLVDTSNMYPMDFLDHELLVQEERTTLQPHSVIIYVSK